MIIQLDKLLMYASTLKIGQVLVFMVLQNLDNTVFKKDILSVIFQSSKINYKKSRQILRKLIPIYN